MKSRWLLSLVLMLLGLSGVMTWHLRPEEMLTSKGSTPIPSVSTAASQAIQYELHSFTHTDIHALLIPKEKYQIQPGLLPSMGTVADLAQTDGAIAILNGGFFDPANGKTTSYVMVNGSVVADPRDNERLMGNPDLQSYLGQILDRSEFRRYQCGERVEYAIARHSAPIPTNCQLVDALGAGPQLLPDLTLVEEGFLEERDGAIVRDALGAQQRNARSAIGIRRDGMVVWVMAAQRPDVSHSGVSLPELADFLRGLGVETALNLDGGSSASFCYEGECFFGKVNQAGDRVERPVKSVLKAMPLAE
ncbi:MAG: phosphodiester glycosidase family protein [Leptolyngbyaceae cyanobacterium SL_7_1]|nr:phosphodiester glycosidase family protein [Leptolyngbyaceae cyanobacterium SL_7_1]